MKFVFDLIPPATLYKPTSKLILFVGLVVFVVLPIVLAILEYRLARVKAQYGLYLIGGVIVSALALGLYPVFLAVFLLLPFAFAVYRGKQRE